MRNENFKDYFLTAGRVQQFDGNFIEPEFHLTGGGIGVFGSAIRDTVTFTIIKACHDLVVTLEFG